MSKEGLNRQEMKPIWRWFLSV